MLRTSALSAAALLLLIGCASGAPRARVEAVFQQGVNHYEGCKWVDPWNSVSARERGAINRQTIVFGDLKLPGENVKIDDAEIRMLFVEEGWSRIPNADLEMYDAAEKEGKPLLVVEYREHKIVGMDPKTRVVAWKLPVELVERWIEKPETNKGVRFVVKPDREGNFQFIFRLPGEKVVERRPRLVINYSFEGEAPPFAPDIATNVAGKTFGPEFTVAWREKRWDPNGTDAQYEIAVAPEDGEPTALGKVDAKELKLDVDASKLDTGKAYRLRMRAVDPTGLASDWVEASGTFKVSREKFVVWTQNSVTKVQREENPPDKLEPVTLAAARGEYESFQVVVSGLSNLGKVEVVAGGLAGPGGAKIAKDAIALYRVHYVDCAGEGMLPDSLVPFIDPKTGRPIGGKFGTPFGVESGTNASVWVEVHVPEDATPGEYAGLIEVLIEGNRNPITKVPVALTVWPVTIPKTSTLLTYMELTKDTPARDYLHALHAHRIDPWFVNDVGPKLERVDGRPVVKWSAEADRVLEDYFSGKLFADGVPGKTYLFPGGGWEVWEALRRGTAEDRIAIFRQYEEHYRGKPWLKDVAWFFIDEPKPETIDKCVAVGKEIREYSPSIGYLLTTRYNEKLVGLVTVWDAIINREVIDWNAPGPDVYRDEMKKGRRVINCITVNCDEPTSPNLFIEHKAMNARIWPWVTYALDQEGIEFWRTNAAPSVTVPKKYGNAWGDGSLFYAGTPAELGVESEIPLPSVRLKALRDGIEDFELLSMVKRKDPALAKKLCRMMAQETKDYDRSFADPVQHISWNWNTDGKGDRQVPGYVIWESSAARLAAARAAIAKAIAEGQ